MLLLLLVPCHQNGWGDRGNSWASDVIASVDAAVADGADIISYSESADGTQTFQTPFEIAFRNAATAGVFFSAAGERPVTCRTLTYTLLWPSEVDKPALAPVDGFLFCCLCAHAGGNTGPDPGTITDTYSPWITTVAASTHSRRSTAAVTLGSGDSFTGASLSFVPLGPAALVLAADVAAAGADPEDARLCYAGTLDAGKVAGMIVACDRGVSSRASKAAEVGRVGGLAMLLLDAPDSGHGIVTEVLAVPHIHLPLSAYNSIHSYASSAGSAATASLAAAVVSYDATAPVVSDFSSRGPIAPGDGNLLKPDIAGVQGGNAAFACK